MRRLGDQLFTASGSVKDDDGDEKKKPASKYHKAGAILQLPTPPKMMYDYPLWRDWMKEVDTMLNNQQEALSHHQHFTRGDLRGSALRDGRRA